MKREPVLRRPSVLLHGADYNPEQWLSCPEILAQDIALMKLADINCVSLGIFAWAALEPREGEYCFDWLEQIVQNLYANGIYTVLATPSGAKPAWMAEKYPEILRVSADRQRDLQGGRHNHCFTSPVYRRKVQEMNTRLAAYFANNPAVILWHVSNEIQGECHCPLCQDAFRGWLQKKYGTLDALNQAYWANFWSHTYTAWSQLASPAPQGETNVHGLTLDWKRFCTDQTTDFLRAEIAPLKAANPQLPVTINLMGFYDGLDYRKLADCCDVLSWDAYPCWHNGDGCEAGNAMWTAAFSDNVRAMKQQPYLLMECTPSTTNWHGASRHKAPGMHRLSAVQQLAHGSNSVQYFQWRQSRGSCEKFHSAVVSHNPSPETRIFKQVSEVGALLRKLPELRETTVEAHVAILYDVQNLWALRETKGPRNEGLGYTDLILRFYEALWAQGISVDLIDLDAPLDGYRLVIAPMTYQLRGDYPARARRFVENGGTLLGTYFSGVTDENDLCFLGETPAQGLNDLFGIWAEDIDGLYDHQHNSIEISGDCSFEGEGSYRVTRLCELLHLKTAEVLGTFGADFYAGLPALTVNHVGKGAAYYLAGYAEPRFMSDFLTWLCPQIGVPRALETALPYGVTVGKRVGDAGSFYFLQNYNRTEKTIELPFPLRDLETGAVYQGKQQLPPYAAYICTEEHV